MPKIVALSSIGSRNIVSNKKSDQRPKRDLKRESTGSKGINRNDQMPKSDLKRESTGDRILKSGPKRERTGSKDREDSDQMPKSDLKRECTGSKETSTRQHRQRKASKANNMYQHKFPRKACMDTHQHRERRANGQHQTQVAEPIEQPCKRSIR